MKISELEFPNMRVELVEWLECLWDGELQERVWVRGDRTRYAPFFEIIHFLYDDTQLSEDPSGCIGEILLNEAEADAIRAVTAAIDLMVERHGWQDDEAAYPSLPEWPAVMVAARHAFDLINPGTPTIEEALAAMPDDDPPREKPTP